MKKLILFSCLIINFLSASPSASAQVYWAVGEGEGPCLDNNCTCIVVDHMHLGRKDYCIDYDHEDVPFVRVSNHGLCPDGSDTYYTQRGAIKLFYDVEAGDHVQLVAKNRCAVICHKDGSNCRFIRSTGD